MQMTVRETCLGGCYEIVPHVFSDERGLFVKTYHERAFRERGLETDWREEYHSVSRRGVLRGLHFQLPPHDHVKLVYCTSGAVLDAALDLRAGSPTFGRHLLLELSGERGNMIYLPSGLAHGFLVQSESATVCYRASTVHAPDHDGGVLWSSAGIPWPVAAPIVSARDRSFVPLGDFVSPFRWRA
jgi:dTDP-4-dehydrorhamnose 3,5-epimerase